MKNKRMKKSKSLSSFDSQEIPNRMKEFIRMKEQKMNPKIIEKDPLPTPEKPESSGAAFKKMFGETEYQFNKRMDEEVRMLIQQTKSIPDAEPELAEEFEKKKEKKRAKRKMRDQKKKEKKRKKEEDRKMEEEKVDKVDFGDVVLAPPKLDFNPKITKRRSYNFMKKFTVDGSKFQLKKK